ncbi:MAG: conjugal transfer protein TraX, partial [Treponema sp.]|nr:conjugal transfer protein TraX [Treponema sp.]
LFLCAEGYYHTRSKTIYLLRFLGAFILMNLGNEILTKSFTVEDVALINNIFGTLCVSAFYMLMVDLLWKGIQERKTPRIILALGGMLLPLLVGFALMRLIFSANQPSAVAAALFSLIPTPVTVEGGIFQVGVGVAFYLLRTRRRIRALVPAAAGLLVALISRGESSQWLMVFAALPILLYNGRRGWGGKYFFYAFYPAHIYLLYLIAWFLQSRG